MNPHETSFPKQIIHMRQYQYTAAFTYWRSEKRQMLGLDGPKKKNPMNRSPKASPHVLAILSPLGWWHIIAIRRRTHKTGVTFSPCGQKRDCCFHTPHMWPCWQTCWSASGPQRSDFQPVAVILFTLCKGKTKQRKTIPPFLGGGRCFDLWHVRMNWGICFCCISLCILASGPHAN